MREHLMNTTSITMVPNSVQQWQAKAGESGMTPPAEGGAIENENVDFSAVFEQLTQDDPVDLKEPEGKVETQGKEPEGAKGADEGLPDPKDVGEDGGVKGATDEAAPGATGATGATADPAPAAPGATGPAQGAMPSPQGSEDFFRRFGEFLDQRKTEPAKEPTQAAPQGPEYTADEKAMLDAYEKEFPEVSKAEEIKRREEYKALINYIGVQMGQALAPLMQQANATSGTMHEQALQRLIPDYNAVRDPVIEWASKAPPVFKRVYDQIVKDGSPEDIAMLVDQWRIATGQKLPAGATGAAPPAAAGATGATGAAPAAAAATGATGPNKKTIDALRPPGGRRTVVPQNEISKDDFKGAFDAFAEAEA